MNINLRPLLFGVFFLSGVAGLIYESIWTHYLKLFLGHAAYAQTLVLALFMGGMAIGAWLSSRFSSRWSNPLLGYALIEGVIGVAAWLFHPLFIQLVQYAFDTLIPAIDNRVMIHLVKWLLASGIILPQSILLGMTFPLMSSGLLRLFPAAPGGSLATLYFLNSLGGAVGVLASGFWIIDHFGLDGTLTLAGTLNILLAITVWAVIPQTQNTPHSTHLSTSSWGGSRELLLIACLTGCASFIYEIIWLRMLSLVLGSSTHAFELMLSAFILGLALGGWWLKQRIDRLGNPIFLLAMVQILMGLAALLTLPLYGETFPLMQWLLAHLERDSTGYLLFNLASHGIAMAILFPATFCAGMTLPLITRILLDRGLGEQAIGGVYWINTLGAILGILFVVHIGLPELGLKGSLLTGAAMDMGLGLLLLFTHRHNMSHWLPASSLAVVVGGMTVTMLFVELSPHKMASGVYRDGQRLQQDYRVLHHQDGKTATVSLTTNSQGVYSLRTNGKSDASIAMPTEAPRSFDEVTMTLIASIPMLLRPESRKIANIGFGSGLTTHVALANPALSQLDTIEIEPAIVETARLFSPHNDRAFHDPRSTIHLEDAKTFFSTRKALYDIILSEPSNPWVSGVAGLFSVEFYHDLKRYLTPNGLVAQWLQVYEFDLNLMTSILKALQSQFKHITLYAVDHGDLLILASDGPIHALPDQNGWTIPALRTDLAKIGVRHPQDLRLRWIGDEAFLAPLISLFPAPANSDYAPFVDQQAVKARFLGASANEIFFPVTELLPIRNLLAGHESSTGQTKITATPLFSFSVQPYVATALHARVTGQSLATLPGFATLDESFNKMALALAKCRTVLPQEDRVYPLYQLGVIASPHLHPSELKSLWSLIAGMNCGQETGWLELFKAIGQRDPVGMENASTRLLAQKDLLTITRGRYLFGIGLLSLVAQGRHNEASLFWDRHVGTWFGTSTPGLAYRYLLERAVLKKQKEPVQFN
ncbi:MAG: spermidine synthase [Magnetococcales bacterium]|nr:spermidine synthase [Magnetococcales bacterium]